MQKGDIITTNSGMKILIKKVWETFITGWECDYVSTSIMDTDFRICHFENIKKVSNQPTLF